MIQPYGFVFPAGRKLKGITSFVHGILVLEIPFVLQNVGVIVLLDFVADDVPRIGGGNLHDLGAQVGIELAAFDVHVGGVGHILFFDFKVLALGGNAPTVDFVDLGFGVVDEVLPAEMTAIRAQDFVGAAFDPLDLAVGLH